MVRTPGSHPGNQGSIPCRVTIRFAFCFAKVSLMVSILRFTSDYDHSLVEAMRRERQIKGWTRVKKEELIKISVNKGM